MKSSFTTHGSSASLMSASSTQSPATSGRTSPWADGSDQLPRQKPLLIMNIDIGDGRTGRLEIHKGDDCDELAARFCEKHNLPAQFVLKQLSQQIARSMVDKGMPSRSAPPSKPESPAKSEDDESSDESDKSDASQEKWHPAGVAPTESARSDHLALPIEKVVKDAGGNVTLLDGRGCSPIVRGKHGLRQVVPKPGAANNASFSRFAALETFNVSSSADWSSEKRAKEQETRDAHLRIYKRGMRFLEDRKKRVEENTEANRSTSVGRQRPASSLGLLPGHHMKARARSAPRQRPGHQEGSSGKSDPEAITPEPRVKKEIDMSNLRELSTKKEASGQASALEQRQPFRPGGTPLSAAELKRAHMSPPERRSKSVPRERPFGTDASERQVPAYERLFNLASKGGPANESRESSDGKMPWSAAGTHWQRAEQQRMRCSASYTSKPERSHLNRSNEEHANFFETSVHERLYQESRVKMNELQEKEEARRKAQEEQDREATRRRRILSARSEELLAEKEHDSEEDIFDKLYEDGIKKGEDRQRLHEEKLKQREVEALRARDSKFMPGRKVKPFQPDLGKAARSLTRDDAWEDRVENLIQQKRQQEEAYKLEAELNELSKCTFCPQISKFATQYERDLKGSVSLHEALFEQAKDWRVKKQSPRPSPIIAKKVSRKEEEVGLPVVVELPNPRCSPLPCINLFSLIFLLTRPCFERGQAILERLCVPLESREISPVKSRDVGGKSVERVPFCPGGTPNAHWKSQIESARRRTKSPDSHHKCDLEITEKLFIQSKVRELFFSMSSCLIQCLL